ncbi:MAG: hypothetical protein LUM44_02075 [Pyrinomonadaceae bacterium]|nr:hypothetical protein [Pyrinomonadaceae bacterium]
MNTLRNLLFILMLTVGFSMSVSAQKNDPPPKPNPPVVTPPPKEKPPPPKPPDQGGKKPEAFLGLGLSREEED